MMMPHLFGQEGFLMSRTVSIILVCVFCLSLSVQAAENNTAAPATVEPLKTLKKDHPRLLFTAEDQRRIEKLAPKSELLRLLIDNTNKLAAGMLKRGTIEHKLEGPRLLTQSRNCIEMVWTSAMAYRLTNDERFARRAIKEMLVASGFKDWNPSHFLDVAEMTAALGIGYDWLFNEMTTEERDTIRAAIIKNGLKPGMDCYTKGGWWTSGRNNWAQVCNAGLTIGALAIADEEPELANEIVTYGIKCMPRIFHAYAPDGAYPEGSGYWSYGTNYHCLMSNVLQTALGQDFGVIDSPGLSRTGLFRIYSLGTSGMAWNFADGGAGYSPAPAMFELARKFDRPLFAWWLRERLSDELNEGKATRMGRFGALFVAWFDPRGEVPTGDDAKRDIYFHGQQDGVIMRSDWTDPNALFFAVKGGDNQASHSHMDIGAFVLDAMGERWAYDLGGDNYNIPGYWNAKEGGSRWNLYRLNSLSHNTLVIDGKLQKALGKGHVTYFAEAKDGATTVIDISEAYKGQATQVLRGAKMLERRAILIQDEVTSATGDIRWGMLTHASLKIDSSRCTLSRNGKQMQAEILSPPGATFKEVSTKPPTTKENANRGTRMLAVTVPTKGKDEVVRITILIQPIGKDKQVAAPKIITLAKWEKVKQ